jgi:uncharacterized protein YodC (DUF2158 family)
MDMAMTAKVGDIVRLKSGGPLLTVIGTQNGMAMVAWFDNGEMKTNKDEWLPIESLELESVR